MEEMFENCDTQANLQIILNKEVDKVRKNPDLCLREKGNRINELQRAFCERLRVIITSNR